MCYQRLRASYSPWNRSSRFRVDPSTPPSPPKYVQCRIRRLCSDFLPAASLLTPLVLGPEKENITIRGNGRVGDYAKMCHEAPGSIESIPQSSFPTRFLSYEHCLLFGGKGMCGCTNWTTDSNQEKKKKDNDCIYIKFFLVEIAKRHTDLILILRTKFLISVSAHG